MVYKENGYSYLPASESINMPHCFLLGRWNVQINLFLQVVADLLNTFYLILGEISYGERGTYFISYSKL